MWHGGINGNTRLYVIVGDPVTAVRSPEFFNDLFRSQQRNAILLPLHVESACLKTVWEGLKGIRNLDGVIVTMPHKRARRQGHPIAGRRAFQVGLGGAGSAVAVAMLQAGLNHLVFNDADSARCNAMLRQLQRAYPDAKITIGQISEGPFDLAINATPLGMKDGDPLPFDLQQLPRSTLIVDVITKPEMTLLLVTAEKLGHHVHTGRHMHHSQALAAATFFGLQTD